MLHCDALTGYHVSRGIGQSCEVHCVHELDSTTVPESVDMVRAVCRICTYNGQFIYEFSSAK